MLIKIIMQEPYLEVFGPIESSSPIKKAAFFCSGSFLVDEGVETSSAKTDFSSPVTIASSTTTTATTTACTTTASSNYCTDEAITLDNDDESLPFGACFPYHGLFDSSHTGKNDESVATTNRNCPGVYFPSSMRRDGLKVTACTLPYVYVLCQLTFNGVTG